MVSERETAKRLSASVCNLVLRVCFVCVLCVCALCACFVCALCDMMRRAKKNERIVNACTCHGCAVPVSGCCCVLCASPRVSVPSVCPMEGSGGRSLRDRKRDGTAITIAAAHTQHAHEMEQCHHATHTTQQHSTCRRGRTHGHATDNTNTNTHTHTHTADLNHRNTCMYNHTMQMHTIV